MKIRKEDNCTVTVTIIKARQQPREGHTSPVDLAQLVGL